ncbi:MAG: 6-phosphogluconolactonase [Actinobacteria bacterium HGW-Actinobacteria-5]|jgi:6-phosphogluconolactonase|nr:MAG: 6-phosphogluconolactonase [Actinobacteria bacterium HGW-Actinobacteria-5]
MSAAQPQVVRYADAAELADHAAARLLATLIELQADGHVVQVCLTGGRIAHAVYALLGEQVSDSALDPTRLELWWGDERFVPTGDPERNAGPTLALLAGHFPLDPSRTHPMPSADGVIDAAASAATYAKELGDTRFDLCLLGLGPDGHVASIFPNHPSSEPTTQPVIGVSDAPKPPPERISLTIPTLNESSQVWFLVSGTEKSNALSRSLAGDTSLPAGRVAGRDRTLWLVDQAAASELPYFDCVQ